jgi:hypothetical protein
MSTTPSDPDDPVASAKGKYAWIMATSDEMREEDREADIARSDEDATIQP